jgi:K+-sensing histidine kinase KdpD
VAAWASGNSISVAVSDRGPGVAKCVMEQLGTPFLQGDLSYGRRWEGVGLGLALSTRIVRAHGGRLSLAPRLDGGTVAVIELPPRECDDATTKIAGARRLAHGLAAKDRDAIGPYAERDDLASVCPALSG